MGTASRVALAVACLCAVYWYVTSRAAQDQARAGGGVPSAPPASSTKTVTLLRGGDYEEEEEDGEQQVGMEDAGVYAGDADEDEGDPSLTDPAQFGGGGEDYADEYSEEEEEEAPTPPPTKPKPNTLAPTTLPPPPPAAPTSPAADDILPEDEDEDMYDEEGDALVKAAPENTPAEDEATVKALESRDPDAGKEEGKYDADLIRECKLKRSKHPGVYLGPRVQYVHVPKAGGTSIQEALRAWVGESDGKAWLGTFDGPSTDGSSTKCPSRSLDYTVLMGHRGFGFCKDVEESPRGLFTFTALREPVARIVSMFDYKTETRGNAKVRKAFMGAAAGKKGKKAGPTPADQELTSLNELIRQYNATAEIEPGEARLRFGGSQQARFLCGYECLGPAAEKGRFSEKELLARARKNLQKLDAVGVVERLDELIPQLKLHLTLVPPRVTKWPVMNVASSSKTKKSVLDAGSKEVLRQWAWVDQALYKDADKLARVMHERSTACLKLIRGGGGGAS